MKAGVLQLPQREDESETLVPLASTLGPAPTPFTTAELAECTCPEPCERDHDRD